MLYIRVMSNVGSVGEGVGNKFAVHHARVSTLDGSCLEAAKRAQKKEKKDSVHVYLA